MVVADDDVDIDGDDNLSIIWLFRWNWEWWFDVDSLLFSRACCLKEESFFIDIDGLIDVNGGDSTNDVWLTIVDVDNGCDVEIGFVADVKEELSNCCSKFLFWWVIVEDDKDKDVDNVAIGSLIVHVTDSFCWCNDKDDRLVTGSSIKSVSISKICI